MLGHRWPNVCSIADAGATGWSVKCLIHANFMETTTGHTPLSHSKKIGDMMHVLTCHVVSNTDMACQPWRSEKKMPDRGVTKP